MIEVNSTEDTIQYENEQINLVNQNAYWQRGFVESHIFKIIFDFAYVDNQRALSKICDDHELVKNLVNLIHNRDIVDIAKIEKATYFRDKISNKYIKDKLIEYIITQDESKITCSEFYSEVNNKNLWILSLLKQKKNKEKLIRILENSLFNHKEDFHKLPLVLISYYCEYLIKNKKFNIIKQYFNSTTSKNVSKTIAKCLINELENATNNF